MNLRCFFFRHKPKPDPIYELSIPPAYNTFTIRCVRCGKILKQVSQQVTFIESE